MNGEKIGPLVENIREIDAKIVEVARTAMNLIDRGATFDRIDDEVGFLETLFRRRQVILHEYKQAGGEVKDLYTFGARVAKQ